MKKEKQLPEYKECRVPYERLDLQSIENYLTKMASQGYMVTKLDTEVKFKLGEPQNLMFRLDPVILDFETFDPKPKSEDPYLFDEDGWTYVGPYLNMFAILYQPVSGSMIEEQSITDKRALNEGQRDNFLKDHKFRKQLKQTYRKEKNGTILLAAFLLIFGYGFDLLFSLHTSYTYLLSNQFMIYLPIVYKMFLCAIEWMKERTYAENLYCMYSRGYYATIKKEELKKKSKIKNSIVNAFLIAFVIVMGYVIFLQFRPNLKGTLDDKHNLVSNVRLQMIESQEESMSYEGDYTYHRKAFFVPVHIHSEEYGTNRKENSAFNEDTTAMEEDESASNTKDYSSGLNIDYYELRFHNQTETFFEDLFYDKLNYVDHTETIRDESGMIFYYAQKDRDWLVTPDYVQYLIGYYKNKVIYVEYFGRGDIKDLVPSITLNFKGE